jgi:hypothetical protein
MLPACDTLSHRLPTPFLIRHLPGPTRKRTTSPYGYRLTYRNPDPCAAGCVLLWEVSGGRLLYQIALEREESGFVRLHCTCADAIFRAEAEGRWCKHLRGLLEFGRPSHQLTQPCTGLDA